MQNGHAGGGLIRFPRRRLFQEHAVFGFEGRLLAGGRCCCRPRTVLGEVGADGLGFSFEVAVALEVLRVDGGPPGDLRVGEGLVAP